MNEQPLPDIAAQATHHDLPLDWVGMAGIALPIRLADAAVTARVQLLPNGEGGFRLGAAIEAETRGLDRAAAEALVAEAHTICPYSNALKGNVDVAVSVKAE